MIKKMIDIENIIISEKFRKTLPAPYKIKNCYGHYKYKNKLDRDIFVDENNVLVDGYVGYLVCKMLGVTYIEVIVRETE